MQKFTTPVSCIFFAAACSWTGLCSGQQVPITDIQIFRVIRNELQLNNRGDQLNAIDDEIDTASFLTPSFTEGPHIAAIDLGGLNSINRFRAEKGGDTDQAGGASGAPGLAPIDNMDLQLLYTTDTGPLPARNYLPVPGLTNGYQGAELINADSVDPFNATIDNDHHDSPVDGPYSLSFDTVDATAFGLRFARDAEDTAPWTHYFAWELDLMFNDIEHPATDIQVFSLPSTERPLNTRDDAANAIDGDPSTWSFITPAGTIGPQIAGLDLGTATMINRFRVDKFGDTDDAGPDAGAPGLGPTDNLDLRLLYTTDTGPLNTRTYQPVTGLTNGFDGRELINADAVNSADATVDNDHHDTFADGGLYSLTFDPVQATGFGLQFDRDAGDSQRFTHYRVWEMELLNDDTIQPIASISVFEANEPGATVELNNRGDEDLAIDGDVGTWSFLTPAFTDFENVAALDLGGHVNVDRIRVAKGGNTDGTDNGAPGLEPIDNMDVQILFTTDTGPLELRNYQPVAGLVNGYEGAELINADAVVADEGRVDNDHHDFDLDGWYSLSFDPVQASALAFSFARDEGDSAPWTHYYAFEIEVYASSSVSFDFNGDGSVDVMDIDDLVGEIAAGTNDAIFDLSGDGVVNTDDLGQWLEGAAGHNGFAESYLQGDANLDGRVDASDLNQLGLSWQQPVSTWSVGDFTADGVVDAGDLNLVGLSWQQSIAMASKAVPEPAAVWLILGALLWPVGRRSFDLRKTRSLSEKDNQ